MIIDSISHAGRYAGFDRPIGTALRFLLEQGNGRILTDGTYIIDGDAVKAVVITAETVPASESRMEIHRQYMDIHLMLEGEESFGYSSGFTMESEYDEEKDIAFGMGEDEVFHRVRKGDFYIVWPEEAHRPLGRVAGISQNVRKVICKVKIDG